MEKNRKPYKCEWCGDDCVYFIKGGSCGWKCKSCDFAVVTTYNPFRDVAYDYQIKLKPELPMTPEKYKYLSKLLELNYLQLKEIVGDREFVVSKDIYKTLEVMEKLDELGIQHEETPPYPFTPDDEMYQRIKTHTVFSQGVD